MLDLLYCHSIFIGRKGVTEMNPKPFKEYFVSFYKSGAHYVFYKLVHEVEEVKSYIKSEYGKVSNLVIDKVI